MKVLVIPDLHCRKFWRKTISDNIDRVEKVIFLGDYIDPYGDEIENNPETLECEYYDDVYNILQMLNDIISLKKNNPNKYVLLCGNHTDSYIWSKFKASYGRTDYKNWEKYHKFFSQNLEYFNLVYIQDNMIFSHAGITNNWAYEFLDKYMEYDESALDGISYVRECAEILRDTPLKDFNIHYIKAISTISHYRRGDDFYGSCEWADLYEHIDMQNSLKEKKIIPLGEEGIYQIFGHTQIKDLIFTSKWTCLDCKKGFIVDTLTHEITKC